MERKRLPTMARVVVSLCFFYEGVKLRCGAAIMKWTETSGN